MRGPRRDSERNPIEPRTLHKTLQISAWRQRPLTPSLSPRDGEREEQATRRHIGSSTVSMT